MSSSSSAAAWPTAGATAGPASPSCKKSSSQSSADSAMPYRKAIGISRIDGCGTIRDRRTHAHTHAHTHARTHAHTHASTHAHAHTQTPRICDLETLPRTRAWPPTMLDQQIAILTCESNDHDYSHHPRSETPVSLPAAYARCKFYSTMLSTSTMLARPCGPPMARSLGPPWPPPGTLLGPPMGFPWPPRTLPWGPPGAPPGLPPRAPRRPPGLPRPPPRKAPRRPPRGAPTFCWGACGLSLGHPPGLRVHTSGHPAEAPRIPDVPSVY